MRQIDKILISCGKGETSLKQIADMLGWKKGSASVAINQLIEKGLLEKKRYGFYIATKDGQKRIKEIIENVEPHDNIDSAVYRTAALFTTNSRFDMIKTLKYGKESTIPSAQTKELGDAFRSVYLETVNFEHRDNYDMVKSMWRNHQKPVCQSCGFDFEKAYENHAEYIKEVVGKTPLSEKFSKTKLFRNLRWESFPDIEKYRRNFGLTTSYTAPEIPDS